MAATVSLSPVTRIEGHLAIKTETQPVKDGNGACRVTEARCEGEMYRGFERILAGRDPMDAQQITQRICGVCPVSHGIASVRAQEMAYGIQPNQNGRLLQNLIFAAEQLHSHVLHFYQLAALDFVDVSAILQYKGNDGGLVALRDWVKKSIASGEVFPAAPFLPQWKADYVKDVDVNVALLAHYVEALGVRRTCHEMGALFGARLPHSTALVPGGCTQKPNMDRVLGYSSRLKRVFAFIRDVYLPDLVEVAKQFPSYFEIGRGCGNFLSFGVFEMDDEGNRFVKAGAVIDGKWKALKEDQIREEVLHSRYSSPTGSHPSHAMTDAAPDKSGAYSWLKAPRYGKHVMEVGPLARVMVNYHDPSGTWIKKEVDAFLKTHKLKPEQMISVLGRHVCRGLEALWFAKQAAKWLDELQLGESPARDFQMPKNGSGFGLTEAPRGALGHWLTIEDYRVKSYQCVVPTTWNCSPRDDRNTPGPVEQALTGVTIQDPEHPIELGRIVRSFDPCIGCAVH